MTQKWASRHDQSYIREWFFANKKMPFHIFHYWKTWNIDENCSQDVQDLKLNDIYMMFIYKYGSWVW